VLAHDWPADDLWITAVRQDDLSRTVFGRDAWPSLADAVHASCAIPGYFRPVQIDGRRYVDGGVRSPTNADVLRRRDDLDLVVVVSPMSGRDLGRFGSEAVVRRHAAGKLRAELERLDRAGIPTVVIEPGPEVVAALGSDFMSHERVEDIVRCAFLDTGDLIKRPFVRTLLAGLSNRHRPLVPEVALPGQAEPEDPATEPPRSSGEAGEPGGGTVHSIDAA
jgi:NTE family protein